MPSKSPMRKSDPKRARKSSTLTRRAQRATKYAIQGRTARKP